MSSNEVTDLIFAYEADELDEDGRNKLFTELVRTGLAWKLQGHYGRMAEALIRAGKIHV
jgi:hypothetical protein